MTLGICCPTLLGKKIISTHLGIMSASSLFSPFFYIMDDMFAEIYGYQMAKKIIIFETICEFSFIIFCNLIVNYSLINQIQSAYYIFILKNSIYSAIFEILAYIIAWYVNVRLLLKWKILTKGRYFWLRSVGTSSIGIIIFMILLLPSWPLFSGISSLHGILQLMTWSCLLKIVFIAFFAFPISFIVKILKIVEHDRTDNERVNPFNGNQVENSA